MTYDTEFPGFVLDVKIPEGFEDVSHRNDGSPSFIDLERDLLLFVDFADPLEREFTEETSRFALFALDGEGCLGDDTPIIATDDYGEVLAAMEGH